MEQTYEQGFNNGVTYAIDHIASVLQDRIDFMTKHGGNNEAINGLNIALAIVKAGQK